MSLSTFYYFYYLFHFNEYQTADSDYHSPSIQDHDKLKQIICVCLKCICKSEMEFNDVSEIADLALCDTLSNTQLSDMINTSW